MVWTRSETIALALMKCQDCRGLGIYLNAREQEVPCSCALRAIFRACHKRFKAATEGQRLKGGSTVKMEQTGQGKSSHMYFSRKTEEYIADFTNICRRNLTPAEWALFSPRYILGAELKFVAEKKGLTSDSLSHHFAGIEACLGRAFRETTPFALYPLDEYFSDTTRGERVYASGLGNRAA